MPTTIEEMAAAAAAVKKNADIPGIVARGTPSFGSMGTGFLAAEILTDDQWSELDGKLTAAFAPIRAPSSTPRPGST